MTTHLVIPDLHAKPGKNNDRMKWAARCAIDVKADVVVQLGDSFDMESLSSYDKGKKSFEGRRYKADMEAGHNAMKVFKAELDKHNKKLADRKKAQYNPRLVMLGGNHEEGRIERLCQLHPELDGTITLDDMRREEFGWEVIPFQTPITIDGILYNHYFVSGIKGNPISGENPAKTLLQKKFVSCTVGHSHVRDFAERTTGGGKKILGLVAGCFFEWHEDYASQEQNEMWWRGLIVKHDVEDGYYDPDFIGLKRLRELYGKASEKGNF